MERPFDTYGSNSEHPRYTNPQWAYVDAMLDAADGSADEENVLYEGNIWNAGNLRNEAERLIEELMS
jgi:hypothetical protein